MSQLVKNIDEINLHNQIQCFNDNGRVRGHNLKIHKLLSESIKEIRESMQRKKFLVFGKNLFKKQRIFHLI